MYTYMALFPCVQTTETLHVHCFQVWDGKEDGVENCKGSGQGGGVKSNVGVVE